MLKLSDLKVGMWLQSVSLVAIWDSRYYLVTAIGQKSFLAISEDSGCENLYVEKELEFRKICPDRMDQVSAEKEEDKTLHELTVHKLTFESKYFIGDIVKFESNFEVKYDEIKKIIVNFLSKEKFEIKIEFINHRGSIYEDEIIELIRRHTEG